MTSFKLFMAYPGVLMVDDGALFKAMRVAGANGAMTCIHAENGQVIQVLVQEAVEQGLRAPKYHATTRPSILEGEATHRAIRLAELAGTPLYIVHLSAGEALSAVTEARDRGIPIHAETCPHYLFLTAEDYERPGFEGAKYVMTPPLRDHHHQKQLWRGLKTDDLQVVSTDHCPFCFNEQPYGMKYSKQQGADEFQQDPQRRTRRRDAHAAHLRRRGPQARHVDQPLRGDHRHRAGQAVRPVPEEGHHRRRHRRRHRPVRSERAVDHPCRRTAQPRSDYTLFEGRAVKGRVKKVFLRGQCIVDGAELAGPRRAWASI